MSKLPFHNKYTEPGLSYLAKQQTKNGMFASYASKKQYDFNECTERSTTFQTSLILTALEGFKNHKLAKKIQKEAVSFLHMQSTENWTFNYWKHSSPEFTSIRCPEDLDDTFMALTAIDIHQSSMIDETVCMHAINSLITAEIEEGGPYNTWILSNYLNTPWHDVDLGVNSNVAYFLKRKEIELDGLNFYIDSALRERKLTSKYYPELSLIYLLSRWYIGEHAIYLQKRAHILMERARAAECALDLGIAITTFLRFGGTSPEVTKPLETLGALQNKNGSWDCTGFFVEQISQGTKLWSGSEALSTAFCLEAFAEYEKATAYEELQKQEQHYHVIAEEVIRATIERFSDRTPSLQKTLGHLISKVDSKVPRHEITLLPYHAFELAKRTTLTRKKALALGSANLLGWLGYTICDSILDGEEKIHLLPIANICLREVASIFQEMLTDTHLYPLIEEVLDGIEEANTWEHAACKCVIKNNILELPNVLPNYKNHLVLANKSLGHAIGPMIVCLRSSSRSARNEALLMKEFFIHYLIARQMNDDAHDWYEDLEHGFINSISTLILDEWRSKIHHSSCNIEKEKERLQAIFWEHTIDTVSGTILNHIKQAERILKKLTLFKDTEYFTSLLKPLEKSAQKALSERNASQKILSNYPEVC